MKAYVLSLAALPLAACATTGGGMTSPSAGGGMCEADALQTYVGQKADADIGAKILAESGAKTLRWGAPGTMWTMDYREDRVNVRYDDAMIITEVKCG